MEVSSRHPDWLRGLRKPCCLSCVRQNASACAKSRGSESVCELYLHGRAREYTPSGDLTQSTRLSHGLERLRRERSYSLLPVSRSSLSRTPARPAIRRFALWSTSEDSSRFIAASKMLEASRALFKLVSIAAVVLSTSFRITTLILLNGLGTRLLSQAPSRHQEKLATHGWPSSEHA